MKITQRFWKTITVAAAVLFAYCSVNAQNHVSERRVYYLDATYSMVTPSKLWNPVRKDLAKAINAIEDENTEIYVVAFGGNGGHELKTWHDYATDSGKKAIISGFQNFVPKTNTMTYLNKPLDDFYTTKVADGKVTYCFLMTDGKDENKPASIFHSCLSRWGKKFGDRNVYGFYVMLNKEAKDVQIEEIIDSQEHLWKVESADVNINLVRLDNKAMFNVKSDDYIEVPINGNVSNLEFTASFPENSGLKAGKCVVQDGKLMVGVKVTGDKSTMPENFSYNLLVSLKKKGKFDFLVTDKVKVNCVNRRQRILKTSAEVHKFGKVKQYASFLFVPGSIMPVKKTISFDFNEDAKNDQNTFAEFAFVDKKGNAINLSEMLVKVNGEELKNNTLRVKPQCPNQEIEISFSPDAKKGRYKGYLRLKRSNLQRLNNEDCSDGMSLDAFEWNVYNAHGMNPLAKFLLLLVLLLVTLLLMWFCFIKPIKYPRFPKFRKMVLVKRNGIVVAQFTVNFKGARRVVFASNKVKQSPLNRLFTGRIDTVVNAAFEEPITFVPRKKRNAMVKGKGYLISPNPIMQSGTAVITEPAKKIEINLQ